MPYKQRKCIHRGKSKKSVKCPGGCGCGGLTALFPCAQYEGQLVSIGECKRKDVVAYCVKCPPTIYQLPGQKKPPQAPPAPQEEAKDADQQSADS